MLKVSGSRAFTTKAEFHTLCSILMEKTQYTRVFIPVCMAPASFSSRRKSRGHFPSFIYSKIPSLHGKSHLGDTPIQGRMGL